MKELNMKTKLCEYKKRTLMDIFTPGEKIFLTMPSNPETIRKIVGEFDYIKM